MMQRRHQTGSIGSIPEADPAGVEATDRVLVERALMGSADAFTRLHQRYYARVYRLALLRCRSVADAEDVAAETFVRAIAHLPAFRFQGESIFPWLSRIASNLAADLGRRNGGVTLISLDNPTVESVRALLESLPGDAPDPHALAERSETQALLRAAIDTLPTDQAEAILLRFGGDLPLKEIAIALDRSEGAIKSLLHRGLVGLRKLLLSGADEAGILGQMRHTGHAGPSSTANRTNQNYGKNDL